MQQYGLPLKGALQGDIPPDPDPNPMPDPAPVPPQPLPPPIHNPV